MRFGWPALTTYPLKWLLQDLLRRFWEVGDLGRRTRIERVERRYTFFGHSPRHFIREAAPAVAGRGPAGQLPAPVDESRRGNSFAEPNFVNFRQFSINFASILQTSQNFAKFCNISQIFAKFRQKIAKQTSNFAKFRPKSIKKTLSAMQKLRKQHRN